MVIEYFRPDLRPGMLHTLEFCPVVQRAFTSVSDAVFAKAVYLTFDPVSPAARLKLTLMLLAVDSTKPGVLGSRN